MIYLIGLTLLMIAAAIFFGYKVHGIAKVQEDEKSKKYFEIFAEAKELIEKGDYKNAELKLQEAVDVVDTEEALKELEIVKEINRKTKIELGVEKHKSHVLETEIDGEVVSEVLQTKYEHARKMANLYIDGKNYVEASKELELAAEVHNTEELRELLSWVYGMIETEIEEKDK